MHISVRDILAEELGFHRTFAIQGERPELANVILTKPIDGEATLTKTQTGIMVRGWIQTEIELECHRCLSTFRHPVKLNFRQTFEERPGDDDLPIEAGKIDLAPSLEQEILVSLPIKLICSQDCTGVPGSDAYQPKHQSLKDQARIKERKK